MANTGGKTRARRPILCDGGSVAIGNILTCAVGANSIAIGAGALALGVSSVAVGSNARSDETWSEDNGSIAVGRNSRAKASGTGKAAVAIGSNSNSGSRGIVIGYNATGTSLGAIAIGNGALAAYGDEIIAIGNSAIGRGTASVSIGFEANYPEVVPGSQEFCIAIGYQSNTKNYVNPTTQTSSIAIGFMCSASGRRSIVMGSDSAANAHDNSVVFGYYATASAPNEVVFGNISMSEGYTLFHAVGEIAGDLDLFKFDSGSLLGNDQSNMWLLTRGSGGAITLKQVTLAAVGAAPAPGFSVLQVTNP